MAPKRKTNWFNHYGGFFVRDHNSANFLLFLCAVTILSSAVYIWVLQNKVEPVAVSDMSVHEKGSTSGTKLQRSSTTTPQLQ